MIYATPALGDAEMSAVDRIADLRRQFRYGLAQPQRWFGNLRRIEFARAVQGSNSIEGYHATLEDVMAVVEDEETLSAPDETVAALHGYRDAMTYVLQLAEDGSALDIDETLLRSLHFMMLKHDLSRRPGRWRTGTVYVGREPGGEIVYEGPDAALVPDLVHELIEKVRDCADHPLVRAAMAHLHLVMIHPFKAGNGRMARCLQTLILAQQSIVAPVFSSIEEYLGRNTDSYHAVLGEVGQGSWHPTNDARPWVRYCLNAHYQQMRTHLWRIREAEILWDRCEELMAEHRLPARVIGPLCDAARGLRLRNASYRSAATESYGEDVDVQTASRDLHSLVARGLLVTSGHTRGRYYHGSPVLQDVFRDVRSQKPHHERIDLFHEKPPGGK